MPEIDNQDLEHQREKVKPAPDAPIDEQKLEREDRKAEEAVRKFEESLTKLPPG